MTILTRQLVKFCPIFLIGLAWVGPCLAEEIEGAKIDTLMMTSGYSGQRLFIRLDKTQSSPVGCHTNSTWQYALDMSTPLGEKMYSALLAIKVSGGLANYTGSGDVCDAFSTVETLQRIEIK